MTWDQFWASLAALVIIALYRLLNRYLPPRTVRERDEDELPPMLGGGIKED